MATKALSGEIDELRQARASRLSADRGVPMSERLARVHALALQAAERDQGRRSALSQFDLRVLLGALHERARQWVDDAVLDELTALSPDPTLADDLERFGGDLRDPWAAAD